jgi:ADP-heptose:LPS heptosyltransferase
VTAVSFESVKTITVVRALNLGDLLCAVPSLRALRHRFPDARITLLGLPWARTLVDRYHLYLDGHEVFPGFPGIPEAPFDPARTATFLESAQARPADLVVQLHGDGTSINAFAGLLGGRSIAGFVPPGLTALADPPGVWIPYPSHGSEIHRLLALPAALGAPTDDHLEFRVRADDVDELRAIAGAELLDRPYAVVHAGSSTPLRRWPAARFAAVADRLFREGYAVFLTGTEAERGVVADVRDAMTETAIDVAGRTGLGAMAALVEGARILIANDTGVSHLAAAVGTPSVVVFSGSDPDRWAPLDSERHTVLGGSSSVAACRHQLEDAHRCLGDACSLERRRGDVPAALPIETDEVVAAATRLLQRFRAAES